MIEAAKKARKKLVCGFQFRSIRRRNSSPAPATKGIRQHHVHEMPGAAPPRHSQLGRFWAKRTPGRRADDRLGVHVIEMAHYVWARQNPCSLREIPGPTWAISHRSRLDVAELGLQNLQRRRLAIGQIRFDNGAVMHIEPRSQRHIEKDTWNFTLVVTRAARRGTRR